MSGSSSCSAIDAANRRKKRSAFAFVCFVDQLEVQQRDLLADVDAGFHRAHQQRALAHLARALDGERLPGLANDGQRRRIRRPGQIPGILDIERAAGNGQRRGVRRRQAGVADRRRGLAPRLRRDAVRHRGEQLLEQLRRFLRPLPRGVLDGVEVRIQRVGKRTVELDPDGQDVRRRVCRGVLAGELDLTANHFAAARCGSEQHDQEVAVANVRFDLPGPRLADGEALIDEHGVAGA